MTHHAPLPDAGWVRWLIPAALAALLLAGLAGGPLP